jgi:hypothetical protein
VIAATLGAAFIVAQAEAAPAPPDPLGIQRHFEEALRAEQAGDQARAIILFTALSAEAPTPRVRLELARALFLAGEYRRAKQVFDRVYRGDLPYPVRRSINVFLDDIDQHIGYVRPSVGLVFDSNPTGAARSGVYDIFGAPLAYRSTSKTEVGVSYRLDGLKPIGRQDGRQWQIAYEADGVWFEDRLPRRYGAEAALRTVELQRRVYVSLGWRGTLNDTQRSSSAFVGYERRFLPRPDREIGVSASLEFNRFPGQPYLRGETVRAAAAYTRDLGRATSARIAAGGSGSTIKDSQWPQATAFAQVGAARSLPGLNLNLTGSVSLTLADYGARDIFFGKARSDQIGRAEVALYQARPIFGLFPGVVASYEARRSNIDFYGYGRAGLSVDFRRRF